MPRKSLFNLSHERKLTCNMGKLIPILAEDVIPGDIWKIGNEVVVRLQPTIAPVLHEINVFVHYFFVPYRILWDDWEDYITGGEDGTDTSTLPEWDPGTTQYIQGTLWDYLGFEIGKDPEGTRPHKLVMRAYNKIYNDWYRDQVSQTEESEDNFLILNRAWEKDYFTSAMPWQQKGTAPALPLTGVLTIDGADTDIYLKNSTDTTSRTLYTYNDATSGLRVGLGGNPTASDTARWAATGMTVDVANAVTADMADLRLMGQVQRWMERNARAGSRYTEFLKAHHGEAPKDERLDRPEYIGGSKNPVIVSEVLQTSSTDATTPQGNMAGHGIAVGKNHIGKYRVKEFGVIYGIMSIMPRALYQGGIDRQFIKTTKYDFVFPEFVNLSEQAIYQSELYVTDNNSSQNQTVFGYQGKYDEYRTRKSIVCKAMRTTYDYWHISRQFASAPTLNSGFIECDPRYDWLADSGEDAFLVSFGNVLRAIRPLPIFAEPGLMDH